jgi:hypothetical protein
LGRKLGDLQQPSGRYGEWENILSLSRIEFRFLGRPTHRHIDGAIPVHIYTQRVLTQHSKNSHNGQHRAKEIVSLSYFEKVATAISF